MTRRVSCHTLLKHARVRSRYGTVPGKPFGRHSRTICWAPLALPGRKPSEVTKSKTPRAIEPYEHHSLCSRFLLHLTPRIIMTLRRRSASPCLLASPSHSRVLTAGRMPRTQPFFYFAMSDGKSLGPLFLFIGCRRSEWLQFSTHLTK